ncbi:MAG TPA: DUF6056 family protein [Longilinea sp.]|nr:DUF6056 family protein [Longilinea sp.]
MKKAIQLPRDKYPFFAIGIIIVLLVPLILYGYIGIFSRYAADDYETAGALARSGFWGAQQYWYLTWSGRISYFALVTLVEMIGIRAVPYLTVVCLSLWLFGLAWLLRQIFTITHVKHPVLSSTLGACLILFITLRSLNLIHQILFWQTGLLTYPAYLIFFTFSTAVFVWLVKHHGQQPASFLDLSICFLLAFFMGGLSEISTTFQITFISFGIAILIVFPRLPFRKTMLGMFVYALLGSAVALAIMALAPGNQVRAVIFAERPDLAVLLINSLKNLFSFLGNWIDKQPILVALCLLLPFITGLLATDPIHQSQEMGRIDLWLTASLLLSTAAIFLFLWSCFFVSFYVMSANPPDRALVIPQYILVIFVGTWSFLSGCYLKQSVALLESSLRFWQILVGGILALCLLLGPIYASMRIASTIETSRSIAMEWDQRDAIIRAAIARGEKNVTVWYIRDLNRLGDYSSDPNFLVNRAAADYYHLESIIALDK